MVDLHRAALIRAYRTLAQGLGGSAVTTALAAVIAAAAGGEQTLNVALLAAAASLGTTLQAAFGSFWQGVAQGLPEADEPLTDHITRIPEPDSDGHVRWTDTDL